MKKLQMFLLMVSLLIYAKVNATGQEPDIIIYRDSTMNLCSLPLYQHPDTALVNSHRFFKSRDHISTGNWRGYVATWSIIDGHLNNKRLPIIPPIEVIFLPSSQLIAWIAGII